MNPELRNSLFDVLPALVVELVDTQDLKSCLQQCGCGFNSRLGHFCKSDLVAFIFYKPA